MSTAATSFPERNAAEAADLALVARCSCAPECGRAGSGSAARCMIGQVASYSLGAFVLLLYAL